MPAELPHLPAGASGNISQSSDGKVKARLHERFLPGLSANSVKIQ